MSVRISFKTIKKPSIKEVKKKDYDIIVVGGGAAGITAAIYSARYNLKTLLITENIGGQMTEAGYIENYPGFKSILGPDLANKFYEHLTTYNVDVELDNVTDIVRDGNNVFNVRTGKNVVYKAKAVILAVGVRKRRLRVPGEDEYSGKGVSYCAPCDAPLFRGKVVAVIGGGNSAANAALLISEYASKVYIIHRRSQFRAEPIYVDKMRNNPKIEFILNAKVKLIGGGKTVEYIVLDDGRKINVNGVFIEIGAEPPTEFFKKLGLETDDEGYVKVKPDQSTNISGMFAAGDCTTNSMKFKQIATAIGEGALAAWSAREYILRTFKTNFNIIPY